MNIKSKYLRNLLAVVTAFALTAVVVMVFASQTTSAQAPPPATDPSRSLQDDSQCTAGADACVADPDTTITDCSDKDCNIVKKYLNPFINLMTILVGIAVTIGIIIGGIQYSASGGDPQKAANGKKHIRNSIIALVAFIFLYAFIRFLTPGNGLFTV